MNRPHRTASAILLGLLALTYPHAGKAEETGASFAQRSVSHQNAHIQISVTMAAFIAGQTKRSVSQCITDWYFGGEQRIAQRNAELRRQIIALQPPLKLMRRIA